MEYPWKIEFAKHVHNRNWLSVEFMLFSFLLYIEIIGIKSDVYAFDQQNHADGNYYGFVKCLVNGIQQKYLLKLQLEQHLLCLLECWFRSK